MPAFFSLVKELTPKTTLWVMKVRLVRYYEVPTFGNNNEVASFEYIFQDREGDRIHASARGQTLQNFKAKAVDGSLYVIKDFIVTENRMKYKTTNHAMRIIFLKKTKMEEIFDEKFPATIYQLKSFTEVNTGKELSHFVLFDLIGRVVSCELPPITTARGKRMEFTLEDCEKNQVICTVWDDYVENLLPYVDTDSEDTVIVMLEFGRISVFGEQVRFCNTYHVTKITVNGTTTPFTDFKQSLFATGVTVSAPTTIASCSAPTVADTFKNGEAEVKTLAELVRCESDGCFWVAATIRQIETLREWCYLSCSKCSKKLIKERGGFQCVKCGVKEHRGQYRYKIEVLMQDETGVASFLLWDNESTQLIGKTANDVMKTNPEAFNFVPKVIEEALQDCVGIFKVQVKESNQTRYSVVYNVVKVMADDKILSIFYEQYVDKKPNKATLCIEGGSSENNLKDSDVDKGYEADTESDEDEDDIPLLKLGKRGNGDVAETRIEKKKELEE